MASSLVMWGCMLCLSEMRKSSSMLGCLAKILLSRSLMVWVIFVICGSLAWRVGHGLIVGLW